MLNSENQLRSIAITKVAEAYLRHRIGGNILALGANVPVDSLSQDIWLIIQTQKIYLREGARDLNVKLDGELLIRPTYHHHSRKHGLLSVYESLLLSHKAETALRVEIYKDLARMSKPAPKSVIMGWSDMLDLDPDWSEKMIRTYTNHRKTKHFPIISSPYEFAV